MNKKTKYDYYNKSFPYIIDSKRNWEESKYILNNIKIRSIVGDNYGIHIDTNEGIFPYEIYFCKYEPKMVEELWAINERCADIIESMLGEKCANKDDVRIKYMAKVLGEK